MFFRKPLVAGSFYPSGKWECEKGLKKCLEGSSFSSEDLPERILAGIVPHAGWIFSGETAGRVFRAIAKRGSPSSFVLFGAVHCSGVKLPAVFAEGSWGTPLGEVSVDRSLAAALLEEGQDMVEKNSSIHFQEHSIEVIVPFVRYLFPEATIVPIMVPPHGDCLALGRLVARVLEKQGEEVVVLGSTDLTHYGALNFGFAPMGSGPKALKWVKETNDRRLIDLILNLSEEDIIPEVRKSSNACGAGAIAATVAYSKARGKEKGVLLGYTTSYDVFPKGEASDFVGYAAILF